MKKLGISIYPEKASLEENINYLNKAFHYGFKRVFTCLLSVDGDKEQIMNNFHTVISHANQLGMEVMVDVSPRIFDTLGISYKDLSFFKNLEVWGIRLDLGFTGSEESLMTYNEYGLKIEINMSNNTHYIDTIMDYLPNKDNLVGSHNFYPHNYSGLNLNHFRKCTANFKKYGLETAAFINGQTSSFGPWPVNEGLCTLENHRDKAIDIQAMELFAEGIDTVIIANCFPSENELKILGEMNKNLLEFRVEKVIDDLDSVEESILFDTLHFNRGDVSDNLVRSTQSRVRYKGKEFLLKNPVDIKKGDIIIESSLYGHYAGELQIAKNNMKNSGKSSVVGKISKEYHYILDKIRPWEKFILKR